MNVCIRQWKYVTKMFEKNKFYTLSRTHAEVVIPIKPNLYYYMRIGKPLASIRNIK